MSFFNIPLLSFLKNGIQTPVNKDTTTPANSTPLPVELTGASGDVAINAANLHMEVQLSDQGVDPDVTRIGDGTNQLLINADGSINVSSSGGSSGAVTPTIENATIADANTEQSYALPASSTRFIIKARDCVDLKLAYIATQSGTDYISIPSGIFYEEDELAAPVTLYYQSPTLGATIEIVSWSTL